MVQALGRAIGQLFGLGLFIWLIGVLVLLGIVALITWVIKKVWHAGSETKKKQENHDPDDWLNRAQERQYNRYDYTDPVRPKQWNADKRPDHEPNWAYNETSKMWVDANQMDRGKAERANEDVRRKWQAVYEEEETIKSVKAPVYLTPEEQELAKQIHNDRSRPTFEEWKAQQEKKKTE